MESERVATDQSGLGRQFDGRLPLRAFSGKASYYADKLIGRRTASGERYDPDQFTAAHRKLPFGTIVRVVRNDTGRRVYVRITDRGPYGSRRRVIDLSKIAARRLGMLRLGVVDVRVEVVHWGGERARR